VLLQPVSDGEEQRPATIGMGELSPAEAHRDLELVTLVEELRGRPDLRLDVVLVDLRRDADLFPGDRLLLLLRVFGLLLLVVAVLSEVTDPRDRRLAGGRDLDEVVPLVLRLRERARGRDDAQSLAFGADEADVRSADRFVDPQLGRGYRAASFTGVGTPLAARPLPVEERQVERVYITARLGRGSPKGHEGACARSASRRG
jgi:hypothetical protein